jgi:DNA-binding NarL/FixJ family response regulator
LTVNVVLADDHPIVLDGLRRLFEAEPGWRICACCGDGETALDAVEEHGPGLLVLDLKMPRRSGVEVIRALAERGQSVPTVVLTAGLSNTALLEVVGLGVRGLVLKDQAPSVLLECARAVLAGGTYFEEDVTGPLMRQFSAANSPLVKLTPREKEIAWLAASGLKSRAISDRVGITEGTVKIHLHNVYQKLEVANRVELTNRIRNAEAGKG